MAQVADDVTVIDVEMTRAKVRFSKKLLLIMVLIFASLCWFVIEVQLLLVAITVISFYHFLFHAWCDTEDPETLLSRHELHVYLVMVSDLALVWVGSNYNNVFSSCLRIIVVPLSFVREVGSVQHVAIFLPLHAAMVTYTLRADLLGDGLQWLGNLLIVDAMVFNMSSLHLQAKELGRLLQIAYDKSQRMSQQMTEHLLTSLCDAFVVVDEDLLLCKASKTIGAMLSRSQENVGKDFTDYIDMENRDYCREHFRRSVTEPTIASDAMEPLISSIKVMLADCMNKSIDVNLFFAKLWGPDGEYIYYIGISQAWHPQKKKTDKSTKKGVAKGAEPESLPFLYPLDDSSLATPSGPRQDSPRGARRRRDSSEPITIASS